MHNRIIHLLFFCLLLVAGLLMASGITPNPFFGIRTPGTLIDAEQWRATNAVAGVLMMLIGWLGFFLLSLLRNISAWRLFALISASTLLLLVPPALPATMSAIHDWLSTRGVGGAAHAEQLLAPLLTLLLVGGVGNVLYFEMVPRNRYLGFRLRAAMQSSTNWQTANHAGGKLLHWLSSAGVLAACAAAASGHISTAVAFCLGGLLISPLVAYAAAAHSLRQPGN